MSGNVHTGGYGTGEDVTWYKLDNFVLTPGAGGQASNSCTGFRVHAGGGGGVIVNGNSPAHEFSIGKGYGAGGGGCNAPSGSTGAILVELLN